MKTIPLTKGKYAIVDDSDFERVSKLKWYYHSRGYAAKKLCANGKEYTLLLHHFIAGKPPLGLETDHINRDRLDNRRANLHFVTRSENLRNRGVFKKLHARGITFHKRSGKWQAQKTLFIAHHQRKNVHLGLFDTPKEAASAFKRFQALLDASSAATVVSN